MSNKTNDYLRELNLFSKKNISIEEQIAKKTNNNYAIEICNILDERGGSKPKTEKASNSNFYDLKNKTLESSMAVSSAFDSENVKNFCKWIENNQDKFGKTILEVGCDQGIISCFLARLFPESIITSIDRCEKAIDNAKELANKLNVKNVNFICIDLTNLNDMQFDTVLSIRTIHENYDSSNYINPFIDFIEVTSAFQKEINKYVNKLCSLVKNNGNLINIERQELDPTFCALFFELLNNHFEIQNTKFTEINSIEENEFCKFTVLNSVNKKSIYDKNQYIDKFWDLIKDEINLNTNTWEGWKASILLSLINKTFKYGYDIFNEKNQQVGTFRIWQSDDGSYFYDHHPTDEETLFNYSSEAYESLIEYVDNVAKMNKDLGFIIKKVKN